MKRARFYFTLFTVLLVCSTSSKGSGPQTGPGITADKKQCPLTVVTLGALVDDMPCTLNFELHRLATLRFLDMEPFAHIRHCKHLVMLDGAPGDRHAQDKFTAWKRNVEYFLNNDARFESVEMVYMNRSRTCVPRMVKTALGMTTTPFVLLQQLDRSFTRDVSLGKVVRYMMNHPSSLRLMNWEPLQMPDHMRMGEKGIRWGFGARHGGPDFDFPATRAISYLGDHTNLASSTYFEELLLKTVDDYSRSCFWEDYWQPLTHNQTLQELSDRAWFIYGRPGDFGYSHHVGGGHHGTVNENAGVIEPQICTNLWRLQWVTGLPVLAKSCSDMGCRNSWKTWYSYWEFVWPKQPLGFNHIRGNFSGLLAMLAGPAVAICYCCRRAFGPLSGPLSLVRKIQSRWAGHDFAKLRELDQNDTPTAFGRQQDTAL